MTYAEYTRERLHLPTDAPATTPVLAHNLAKGMRVFCEGEWRAIVSVTREYEHRYDISCGADYEYLTCNRGEYLPVLAY